MGHTGREKFWWQLCNLLRVELLAFEILTYGGQHENEAGVEILCNSRKQAVLLTKFGCNIQLAALSKFLTYFCSITGHVTF